jgi:hypothetical protein
MELIVFCHSEVAYLVPNHVAKKAKELDNRYHDEDSSQEEDDESVAFFKHIRETFKPIMCGHLLTGDIS